MTPLYGPMVRLNNIGPRSESPAGRWHSARSLWHLHDAIWLALDRQGR